MEAALKFVLVGGTANDNIEILTYWRHDCGLVKEIWAPNVDVDDTSMAVLVMVAEIEFGPSSRLHTPDYQV